MNLLNICFERWPVLTGAGLVNVDPNSVHPRKLQTAKAGNSSLRMNRNDEGHQSHQRNYRLDFVSYQPAWHSYGAPNIKSHYAS